MSSAIFTEYDLARAAEDILGYIFYSKDPQSRPIVPDITVDSVIRTARKSFEISDEAVNRLRRLTNRYAHVLSSAYDVDVRSKFQEAYAEATKLDAEGVPRSEWQKLFMSPQQKNYTFLEQLCDRDLIALKQLRNNVLV